MTTQSEEEIDLDQDDSTLESDDATDSQNEDITDDDTTDERKKNSSNWKKMTETKKALERDLRAEREAKAELKAELSKLQDWANSLYDDESKKPFSKKEEKQVEDATSKLEQKIFLLENKDASEHLEDINSIRAKYHMDFDEAWTFVKAKLPPESKTKKDFDLTSKAAKSSKDLSKVSAEDSVNLSKEERAQWRKLHGWE